MVGMEVVRLVGGEAGPLAMRTTAAIFGVLGVLGDLLYSQRIMSQRIFERVRRIELQLEIPPSHYEPGAKDTGHPPTTGAHAGPHTEEREAVTL